MGQDRQFTTDEVKFALSTIKHFKATWEEIERKNLEIDVNWKIASEDFDENYTEYWRAQDDIEIEKVVDEAILNAQNAKTAEGEDELNDAEKK